MSFSYGKVAVVAAAWIGVLSLAAVGFAEGDADRAQQVERLKILRSILRFSDFTAQTIDTGTEVTITSTDPDLVKQVRNEFGTDRPYFHSVLTKTDVKIRLIDNGAVLTFSSTDADQLMSLQATGVYAAYELLRKEIYELELATGETEGVTPSAPGGGERRPSGGRRGGARRAGMGVGVDPFRGKLTGQGSF